MRKSIVPTIDLMQQYRNIFGGPEGQAVLEDILYSLGYGRRLETEEEIARHNVAVELLASCGFAPEYLRVQSLFNDSVQWKDQILESQK